MHVTNPALILAPRAHQDASFDAVTCQYGLQFTPDIPAAITAAARVLRPGGLYVAAVNGSESQMDQVCVCRPLLGATALDSCTRAGISLRLGRGCGHAAATGSEADHEGMHHSSHTQIRDRGCAVCTPGS